MGDQAKTLFMALLFISAGSWVVMEFGPRACGKKTREPDGQAETFAQQACETFVAGDDTGFGDLLVREGDISVDERYGWFPFSGAVKTDFEPWAERTMRATHAVRKELGDARWICGKVIEVDRDGRVRDMQGRVKVISIEITSAGRSEVLEFGPSVRAQRGRVFQGDEDGAFVRISAHTDATAL